MITLLIGGLFFVVAAWMRLNSGDLYSGITIYGDLFAIAYCGATIIYRKLKPSEDEKE